MSTTKAPAAPSDRICEKSNFRCRENIYICRPLRRLWRLAVEYVKNNDPGYSYWLLHVVCPVVSNYGNMIQIGF